MPLTPGASLKTIHTVDHKDISRDILLKCLTVTNLRTEAMAELEGTLAVGVRIRFHCIGELN